jgi:predicted aspartyl protease
LITVSVIGPSNTYPLDGLLDTGAEDTVFPEYLAAAIGIDLTNSPVGQCTTANQTPLTVRYAQAALRLTDGVERREWPAWVGFSPAIQRSLFGFAGFLQFFTATFHGDYEKVELTTNRLYPGT